MEDRAIIDLVSVFDKSSVTVLEIEKDNVKIHLKKDSQTALNRNTEKSELVQPVTDVFDSNADLAEDAVNADNTELITSPIVGTFYAQAAPDAHAYVEVGSKVKAGDGLCIIEAMKIMNELETEFDAEIIKIYPKSGDMLEYGSPIFEVRRI